MDHSVFDRLEGPHLHVAVGGLRPVSQHVYPLREQGKVAVRLRGSKMRRVDGLFDEFAAALQFPYYFGENWPAFDECLTDLDWLGQQVPGYVLVVTGAAELLADDGDDQWATLLQLLARAGDEWATPVEEDEWWDRPGRPFHVVLHETPGHREELLARLKLGGASVGEVWHDEGQ